MQHGGIGGAVIPFERASVPVAKEEYAQAIQLWCKTRDTAEILSREEIGAMPAFERIDAQRKAIILGLAHYYRKHERADVAPGVAVIVALLSDNDKGAATISQQKLADLFGRSRAAISDAQGRLREDGIIVTGRGRYAATYPVIPRAVTQGYNHLTWLIDAVCAQDASSNCQAGLDNSQLSGGTLQLNQSSGPAGQLEEVNCQVEPISIVRRDLHKFTKENSTTLNKAAVVLSSIATAFGVLPAAAAPTEPVAITQPAKPSLHDLTERMLDAGGKAFANPAGAMSLLTYSEQARWLEAGCDIEMDIIPTIRARTAKAPPGSIRSWSYFTQAVADAKAKRTAPMPEGHAPPSHFKSYADQEAERVGKFMAAVRSTKDGSGSREIPSAAPADFQPAEDG